MKEKKRLLTNMASYAILQIVNMLVGLFLPRMYLAVYGSEINGVVSTVNSFISYFSYLEAGLGLTMIHSLFKPLAANDTDALNGLLAFSKKKYKQISYVYFVLVVSASLLFPYLNPTSALGTVEFSMLVFVIGLYGALDFYSMAKYRVLLTADRKEYVISNAMIAAQGLRFVLIWILLKFKLSVAIVKIVPILTLLLRSLILQQYVRKAYPSVNFKENPTNLEGKNQQIDALLLQISISTSISVPTIIISQFSGFKEANVYAVYNLVISSIVSILSALSSGVSPMLGRSIAQGEKINETYDLYDYIVSYLIAVFFSTTVVMILPFVDLYTNVVDDTNYIYPSYAVLFCVWAAIYSYRIPVTAVVNAAAIYRQNRASNILNLLIQVFWGSVATKKYGIRGLLVVMIIAAVQRNISLAINNDREVLHFGIRKFIIRHILICCAIFASYSTLTFRVYARELSVISWCIYGLLTFIWELFFCGFIWLLLDKTKIFGVIMVIKNRFAKNQ